MSPPVKKTMGLVLVLAVVIGLIVLASGPMVTRASNRTLNRLVERMAGGRFRIESVRFEQASVDPRMKVVYRGLRGQVHIGGGSGFASERTVAVEVDRVEVSIVGLSPLRVAAAFDGLSAVASRVGPQTGERLAAAEVLTSGRGTVVLSGEYQRPVDWLREALGDFLRGVLRGDLTEGSRLSGHVEFSVGNHWHSALLFTLVSKEGTRLVLNREDVAVIGSTYEQPLTEAEIDLVALYPLRAPVLLRIKQAASREATRLGDIRPALPEDAFRHVLWSYLLTREFGEQFARQVTDAHEIGATYESGEANREMDLINNEVGRRYAALGVAESELPERVMADPSIRRSPIGSP